MIELKKRNIASLLLLMTFAFYYANISFFFHQHTIEGITICHSHIYGNSHAQASSHTDAEIDLISLLSVFQSLYAQTAMPLTEAPLLLIGIIQQLADLQLTTSPAIHVNLRAPPASNC